MGEKGERAVQPHRKRSWIRRLLLGVAGLFLVLVVFHGPILRRVVHSLGVHFAAKQNLKIADVPIRYRERTYGTTNIQRSSHGWLLLRMMLFAARKLKFV